MPKQASNQKTPKPNPKTKGVTKHKTKWAKKPIPLTTTKNPKIRVVKLFGRFDKTAKEAGLLTWPKPTATEQFENYGICSGHPMKELSPMVLGPVKIENQVYAKNIEDAWQGSKVWSDHLTNGHFDKSKPGFWVKGDKKTEDWKEEWEKWSKYIRHSGLGKRRHFPKDPKGEEPNVPLFSYFQGERLKSTPSAPFCLTSCSYVEARKKMYVRWYWELVQSTEAFKYLKERYDAGVSLNLLEFDGMPRPSPDELPEALDENRLKELLNDQTVIFGHGMVLACALQGFKPWE